MDNNTTTICVNGELKPGDLVLSTPADDFACLVGTVLSINKAGTPGHDRETDNPADSVHVDFMHAGYSERRLQEIEQMLGDLYGRPTTPGIRPLEIDDIIMSPDALIRITDIERDLLTAILDSREAAEALCGLVELAPSAPERESPAQAALHEPDIYDDEATAALREQLIARLDANLTSYFDDIRTNEGLNIPGMAPEIAAVTGAYYYITEIHSFHKSELEYLLQFQNPLQVVADAFQDAGIDDHSDVMWEIFDREAALQSDYERMPNAPGTTGEAALKEELFGRLDKNLSDYCESLMSTDKAVLIGMAEEIAARYAARDYMKTAYDFKTGEVEYLLQFQDPLALVADGWQCATDGRGGMSDIVCDILEDKGSHGHYARVVEASSPVSKESVRDASAEKPSVLEQIREAARAPKEPHKDKPARDKSGPEL